MATARSIADTRSVAESSNAPAKRPRGRPRKYPLLSSAASEFSASIGPLYDPASFRAGAGADGDAGADGAAAGPPAIPPTEEEMDDFKQKVADWARMDDQIKKLSVAVRERRVHQKALGAQIQEFMMQFRYDDLNTRSGIIRSNVRVVPVPLKMKDVRARILEVIGEEHGEEIADKVFAAERPLVEKRSLRRIVPKVSMSLDI
jgi:hypothetical protein